MIGITLLLKSKSSDYTYKCDSSCVRYTGIGFENPAIDSWDELSLAVAVDQILDFLDALKRTLDGFELFR